MNMFGELLESRVKRVRNRGSAVVSMVAHTMFIGLAVMATRHSLSARAPDERVIALPMLPPTEQPHRTAPVEPARTAAPAQPQLPAPLTTAVPVIVPDEIPAIDLGAPARVGIEWRTTSPGLGVGDTLSTLRESGDGIPFAPGVDKPAIALAGNPSPRYPDILRRAGVKGGVVIQVVIDTTGRADMTSVKIISSDHPLLTDAVLEVLPRARFLAAEAGGRKVRMWAVQSFVFEVR
jgi:protein TonB